MLSDADVFQNTKFIRSILFGKDKQAKWDKHKDMRTKSSYYLKILMQVDDKIKGNRNPQADTKMKCKKNMCLLCQQKWKRSCCFCWKNILFQKLKEGYAGQPLIRI